MKLPMSWLKDYMNIDGIDAKTYEHEMTMSGSKVEKVDNLANEIKNVVIGRITKIERHPDADKLVVCQVDVGGESIQIVTGAPNVFEGAVIPVAKHKSTLPGGVKITKGKLRGVMSFGMMCSVDELGIGTGHADGILILPDDAVIGADICGYLGLDEDIVEFEITSNRPDCFSIIGLARETAATFDRKFKIPDIKINEISERTSDVISVEIEDFELCSRFVGRVVKNVKIAPSPEWMQKRLKSCGIRAINNVVDITNYVMLEYGQPMHAYDLDYIGGRRIIVRSAKDGEILETLDGKPRELDQSMTVISDENRAIGVAGVMGGANTEVSDKTTTVFFEAARFNPLNVRRAAKKLGMRTEASALFEKGLDAENASAACDRACQLLSSMCGEVLSGFIDVRTEPKSPLKLKLDADRINKFLGMSIPHDEMVKILNRLEFTVNKDSMITVPSFRDDIETYADIAEEIVRIYGYDKIPSTLMNSATSIAVKTDKQKLEDKVRELATALGLYEITTYSFINPKSYSDINIPDDGEKRNCVKIINPIGEENSVMRTTLIPTTLDVLKTNYSRRVPSVKVFELGYVYIPNPESQLPDERLTVSLGMYGGVDFYHLKGIIDGLLSGLGIDEQEYTAKSDMLTFHPGRCAEISVRNTKIGVLGQIYPSIAKSYKIGTGVFIAEIDFNALFKLADSNKKYIALPKFPAVGRDIALVLDDNITAAEVEKIIKSNSSGILEQCKLFDVYRGGQLGEGKKSVAYSITFRAADRTLTDEEVAGVMGNITSNLEKKLGAALRM